MRVGPWPGSSLPECRPGCDASEVLELREKALDQVALSIEPRAEVRLRPPVHLGRDIGEGAFSWRDARIRSAS